MVCEFNQWEDCLIDVIYLDFSKAFDKVDHGVLLRECSRLGIGGKVGVWLHNFLSGRTQYVRSNGAISNQTEVLSGVPQGTVLAANLFLILINSLKDVVKFSYCSNYADDTKLLHKIKEEKDSNDNDEINSR